MAKPPIKRSGNHPRRQGKVKHAPQTGIGTKITNLPTAELKARDREVEDIPVSQHPGGSGNLIYDQANIWFIRSPAVPQRFVTHIDVRATVGVSSEFDPQESDNYFGIWLATDTPNDVEVKAGTGAIAHHSVLGQPHAVEITHRFDDPAVSVGTQYALHWLAEHVGEGIYERWTGPTYFLLENSAPNGIPVIVGTPTVGETLVCDTTGISDPDGIAGHGMQPDGSWHQRYPIDTGVYLESPMPFPVNDDWSAHVVFRLKDDYANIPNNELAGWVGPDINMGIRWRLNTNVPGWSITHYNPDGVWKTNVNHTDASPLAGTIVDFRFTHDEAGLGGARTWKDSADQQTHPGVDTYPSDLTHRKFGSQYLEPISERYWPAAIADVDLLAVADEVPGTDPFTYQWKRGSNNIPGATGKTYTLTDDDKGQLISCCVTYTDEGGTVESLCSSEVGPIAALNYPATGQPEIEGILREGETVTGVLGSVSDANGIDHATLDYLEWRRDGFEVIPDESEATYLITADDVGRTLQIGLSFTDDDGFAEGPLYSDESAIVQPYNRPATGAPAISGTVLEGETLQGELGTVADENGLPDISTWAWQWYREDAQVGTSARTYVLGADDVGSRIRVQAFFTDLDEFNESTALSSYTIYVQQYNRAATGAPDISGVVFEGNTLTAGLGTIADYNGVPDISEFTWQWLRSGSPIVGETGQTYVIGPADVGSTLSVGTQFTDLAGYEEGWLYSAETITVPGTNSPPTGIPVIVGTALEGEVLTCDTSGIADPDGIDQGSWAYQWVRDGNDVPGQMAQTYTLTGNDVGYAIIVYVHFDDLGGTYEGPLISDPTDIVIRSNREATGKPAITGTAEIEQVLTSTWGNVADANGLPSIGTWRWYSDGVEVHSETDVASSTYTVALSDQGKAITVDLQFTDLDGYAEGPLLSDATSVVPIVEYVHDFDTVTLGGFTHARVSDATMHDYLGNVVTVTEPDPAFVGSEYTSPDTYVDHDVGYGIQLEGAGTNELLHSNDLSNAAWTLTNATLATDVVTATAGNATATQTVTAASGAHTFSVYIYPVTVTGAIEISAGNGVWVAVTPGETTRFTASQTATNPVVGVRIVNSGDAVRIRYAQLEVALPAATSYIETAGEPVTRAATSLHAPFSALSPLPVGGVTNDFCFQVIFRLRADWGSMPDARVFTFSDGTTTNYLRLSRQDDAMMVRWYRGGATETGYLNGMNAYLAGSVLDLRGRLSSTTGTDVWLNVDEKTVNLPSTADIPAALTECAWGSVSHNPPQVEAIRTRIVPYALEAPAIEVWEGWTEPLPIITQQPTDIDLGGEVPPSEIASFGELANLYAYWSADEAGSVYDVSYDKTYVDWTGHPSDKAQNVLNQLNAFEGSGAPLVALPASTVMYHAKSFYSIDNMRAARLEGTDRLEVTFAPSLSPGGLTIAVIEYRDQPNTGVSIEVRTAAGPYATVKSTGNYQFVDGAGADQDTSIVCQKQKTTITVVTLDASVSDSVDVVVDGVKQTGSLQLASSPGNIEKVIIGNNSAATDAIGGLVGGVVIYNRKLSLSEVVSVSALCQTKAWEGRANTYIWGTE